MKSKTIIKDRIKDFTGRKFVFEAINEFLRTKQKGYFVLEAEPGVGKSAIMAACKEVSAKSSRDKKIIFVVD